MNDLELQQIRKQLQEMNRNLKRIADALETTPLDKAKSDFLKRLQQEDDAK